MPFFITLIYEAHSDNNDEIKKNTGQRGRETNERKRYRKGGMGVRDEDMKAMIVLTDYTVYKVKRHDQRARRPETIWCNIQVLPRTLRDSTMRKFMAAPFHVPYHILP